jgi:hypothetical protein
MAEAFVRAELVALPDATASNPVTIAIPRHDVETALAHEDGPMDLVLDVAPAADEPAELRKITISWERDQLEHLLQRADGDVVTVVFDGEGLARMVDPDFELHGLREGLAILAVAVAAGTAAGVAAGAPIDEGASGGSNAAAYTAIEQARGPVVTPDPSGVIEAVRSTAANAGAAGAGIEAVRSAEPLVAADSGAMGAGIEAARSAEAGAVDGTSAASGIEAARSAEPLVAADSGQMAAGIEAVRSAETAPVSGSSLTDDGISISMPSPEVIGLAGGMTLLLLGAAFVSRGRRPGMPA